MVFFENCFLRQSCLVSTSVTSSLEVSLGNALYKSTFYLPVLAYLCILSSRSCKVNMKSMYHAVCITYILQDFSSINVDCLSSFIKSCLVSYSRGYCFTFVYVKYCVLAVLSAVEFYQFTL